MKHTTYAAQAALFAVAALSLSDAASVKSSLRSSKVQVESENATYKNLPAFPRPWRISKKRMCTGYMHVGCWRDIQREQRVYYTDIVPKEDRELLTPEMCWNFCSHMPGTQYFGLENGDRCYCTPFPTENRDYADEMCTMPCVGDHSKICGGQRVSDIYEMHDCNNLPPIPCKRPPQPVPNAKTFKSRYYSGMDSPCANALTNPLDTVKEHTCLVECLPGYTLVHNSLRCQEKGHRLTHSWAQVTGYAECRPVNCGVPPPKDHARSQQVDIIYDDSATYQCKLGYAPPPSNPNTSKIMNAQCEPSGRFEKVDDCENIKCGACPQRAEKYPHSSVQQQGMRVFKDVCTYDCKEGYTLDKRPDGKKSFNITCTHNGEFTEPETCQAVECGTPPLPDFTTPVSALKDMAVFPEVFEYKCINGFTTTGIVGGKETFEVKCKPDGTFSHAPACKPNMCGPAPKADHCTYVDKVYYFSQAVTYFADVGYSIGGTPQGDTVVVMTPTAECSWPAMPPKFEPITCGAPKTYGNAVVNDSSVKEMNFESEPLRYECHPGFSTAVNDDIWNPSKSFFFVSCLATGEFSDPPACVNIDDCLIRNCGPHGTCEDLAQPTGVALDDYTCNCESGYEITLHASTVMVGEKMKRCTNINDCPVQEPCGGNNTQGKARGNCVDAVNGYSCSCGAGYELSTVGSNETCVPVECNVVEAVGNATHIPASLVGQKPDYDTPVWQVRCDPGYSQDGFASGSAEKSVWCQTNGQLTPDPICLPVTCGETKVIPNSDMLPKKAELVFPEAVVYTCDEGHAIGGHPDGMREFQMDCMTHGEYSMPSTCIGSDCTPVARPSKIAEAPGCAQGEDCGDVTTTTTTTTQMACLPVLCGTLPAQAHATHDGDKSLVYGDTIRVDCDEGYSIDGSAQAGKDFYRARCMGDGTFQVRHSCQLVKCLNIPNIAHSTYEPKGPFTFGDSITYTMDAGYRVNSDDVDRINGTFTCHCDANGEFNGTCSEDLQSRAIDCGTPPTVQFATVTGGTKYGETLTATAHTGYTLDGSAQGGKTFTFFCKANGMYSSRLEFQPVKCGPSKEYSHSTWQVDATGTSFLELEESEVGAARNALKVRRVHTKKAFVGARKSHDGLFGDEITYQCNDGYRAKTGQSLLSNPVGIVSPDEPLDFTIKCMETGDYVVQDGKAADTECVPVTCDVQQVAQGQGSGATSLPVILSDHGFARLQYTEKQTFVCIDGYSLDSMPTGLTVYEETCQADGQLSQQNSCVDIDYCQVSQCGDHGSCTDGLRAYNCKCNPGYQVSYIDGLWETCTEIDECDTHEGYTSCSVGGGICVDEILGYKCECKSGYQNKNTSFNYDSCAPVVCEALPVKSHATSEFEGMKLVYPQNASYRCEPGYTLDGIVTGNTLFTVTCAADKTVTNLESNNCEPVKCPALQQVDNTTLSGSTNLVYGQQAVYECNEGHTVSGTASGEISFTVSCLATGSLTPLQACKPVRCGMTPEIVSALGPLAYETYYNQKFEYTCVDGYTLNGQAGSENSFTVECTEYGNLTNTDKVCNPVACGLFQGVEDAQSSNIHYRYGQTVTVVCDPGYTVSGSATDESTFVVACGTDGKYHNVSECKVVTCGVPEDATAQGKTTATVTKAEKFFLDTATWTCEAGYSTNGKPSGSKKYVRECQASGQFGQSSPTGCQDIDFCDGNPCGANGQCQDSGLGVPFPGYSCTCLPGFEVRTNQDGSTRCAADDCAGDPCGEGGTCTDLSKQGGPQGTYQCDCSTGYELVTREDGEGHTCKRVECGVISSINNTEMVGEYRYSVTSWQDKPLVIDAFVGQPKLRSFDGATFTCAHGYSQDRSTAPEAKSFSVECNAFGDLSRQLSPNGECLAIECDNANLPSVTYATVQTPGPYYYTPSGDRPIDFECAEGYTKTGELGGSKIISTRCKANGLFRSPSQSCQPISCLVETPVNSSFGGSKEIAFFGESVQFTCANGHYIGGIADDSRRTFSGLCGSNGELGFVATLVRAQQYDNKKCGDPEDPDRIFKLTNEVATEALCKAKCADDPACVAVSGKLGSWCIGCRRALDTAPGSSPVLAWVKETPVCEPVKCDAIAPQPNTHAAETTTELVFPQGATFTCTQAGDWTAVSDMIFYREGDVSGSYVLPMSTGNPPMTVAASLTWPDAVQFGRVNLLNLGQEGTGSLHWLWNRPSGTQIGVWSGPQFPFAAVDVVLADKIFLVFTHDGSTMKLYINGALVETKTGVSFNLANTNFKVKDRSGAGEPFQGVFHKVGVWTRPLSAQEVEEISKAASQPMTLGGILGGQRTYTAQCTADGTVIMNKDDGLVCEYPHVQVSGIISDATTGSPVGGATIYFYNEDTGEKHEVSATTAFGTQGTPPTGRYTARVPVGFTRIVATAPNYFNGTRVVSAMTSLSSGQGTDVALVAQLASDSDWRFTLTWGAEPRDLDVHVFFGPEQTEVSCLASWKGYSDRAGGLTLSLDQDKVWGYGPETVTLGNVGHCTELGSCLIQARVHKYSWSGSLKDSKAVVNVYRGSQKMGTYNVPDCIEGDWWTVFTIDSSVGANTLHAGDMRRGPFLTHEWQGTQSWATNFDFSSWAQVSSPSGRPALVSGLYVHNAVQLHSLNSAWYFEVRGKLSAPVCHEVDWHLDTGDFQSCPPGSYVNGFFRTGGKYSEEKGFEQLTKARCCEYGLPASADIARHTSDFNATMGWYNCPYWDGRPTALTGLRLSHVTVDDLEEPISEGPFIRHVDTSSSVFVGGNYIQLGVNKAGFEKAGKYGTTDCPAGWTCRQNGKTGIGMIGNVFGLPPPASKAWATLDYFAPGIPEESFWVGFKDSTGTETVCRNCASEVSDITRHNSGTGRIKTYNVLNGQLECYQETTLRVNDKYFRTSVTLKNVGHVPINSVRYMRSVDPDNMVDATGAYGSGAAYVTHNEIPELAQENEAIVWAQSTYPPGAGKNNDAKILYYAKDSRARASFGDNPEFPLGLRPAGLYDDRVYSTAPAPGTSENIDAFISMTFDVGVLGPGQEAKFEFFTALDERTVFDIRTSLEAAARKYWALTGLECAHLKAGLEDGTPACPVAGGQSGEMMMGDEMPDFSER